ncbi:NAD(P)-dependent oxidoreductase [Pseudomonas sp. S5D5]|uniref:NAD-dependent epimerase/dehydratase family protein n=1 Tax=Pseudomonas sp. S5D5 TaxID=2083056 RepID=UPI000D0F42F3|nr:NAD-dependent epimerase/dehydratase [Pseudomonas sp. S5D5]
MKKILLTGATGFLGSALARFWSRAGYRVSALVRSTSSCARIEGILPDSQVYKYSSDQDVLSAIAAVSPDYIVHTACAYGRAGESIIDVYDANVRFGLVLLEGANSLDGNVAFVNTGTVLDAAVSSYAMSKNSFSLIGVFQAGPNVKFVNVALQHMYGPGDDKSKFTTYVVSSCTENIDVLNLTSGIQKRDFIFIDDVVSAYDTIISHMPSIKRAEEVEVGSGVALPVREFVELVHSLTASQTKLNFGSVPYRPNEEMLFRADINRMRSLGWAPRTSLEVGIQKMIDKDILR